MHQQWKARISAEGDPETRYFVVGPRALFFTRDNRCDRGAQVLACVPFRIRGESDQHRIRSIGSIGLDRAENLRCEDDLSECHSAATEEMAPP